MPIATSSSIVKPYSNSANKTVSKIQNYRTIMKQILDTKFPILAKAPDALYTMMAIMGHESSFNIFHRGGTTPNHTNIDVNRSGIGKSYWNDQVIVPIRNSPILSIRNNVIEGISGKALMATMGMYQVRNCSESRAYVSGVYRDIAEFYNLMVEPGDSISAVFTNDDAGATKSMVMGCIIMEQKYVSRLRTHQPSNAMFFAIGDYLGKAGAKDILGTSPEMRVAMVNDTTNWVAKKLSNAGIVRGNVGRTTPNPNSPSVAQGESKTTTVALTNLPPANGAGCTKA